MQGSGSLPDEPLHLKEALSRLVVEITKREWPQKWGSLLPDLNSICALGVSYFTSLSFFCEGVVPSGDVVSFSNIILILHVSATCFADLVTKRNEGSGNKNGVLMVSSLVCYHVVYVTG